MHLEEKIGNPDLFTGRKRELASLLKWIDRIKQKTSISKAIISRRKTGKSALMQRLFNITFEKNNGVVPFYFEIRETDQCIADFSKEFFFTFIFQYIAFKSRNHAYLNSIHDNYSEAIIIAKKEGLDFLTSYIENFEYSENNGSYDTMWNKAREAPRMISRYNDERVIQMIDEFQFINSYIFRDKECTNRITNLAGSYIHTAEYKNAPLLVSGSWVGWLMDDLNKMLPGRFIITDFGNMPKNEAIEMTLNYSEIEQIPVTYETANIIADITEGNPFYISSLFQSEFSEKDFSTEEGILKTLDFETLDNQGIIKGTWMEYIQSSIKRINDKDGKKIILYLCQNRDREVSYSEIKRELNLSLKDVDLEKRLKAFVKSDIIDQCDSHYYFQAVQDNIFDKVFRGIYHDEIDDFDTKTIKNEYKALYKKLQGEYNKYKGEFSEYVIMNHLKHRAYKKNDEFITMMNNLPDDFRFVKYSTICSYTASLIHKNDIQVDIFARAKKEEYSIIGEVKNRKAKFLLKEAKEFLEKAMEVKKIEKVNKAVVFIFSQSGFNKNTIKFLSDNGIVWSDDKRLLE